MGFICKKSRCLLPLHDAVPPQKNEGKSIIEITEAMPKKKLHPVWLLFPKYHYKMIPTSFTWSCNHYKWPGKHGKLGLEALYIKWSYRPQKSTGFWCPSPDLLNHSRVGDEFSSKFRHEFHILVIQQPWVLVILRFYVPLKWDGE